MRFYIIIYMQKLSVKSKHKYIYGSPHNYRIVHPALKMADFGKYSPQYTLRSKKLRERGEGGQSEN